MAVVDVTRNKFFSMDGNSYTRTVNLMDESTFPLRSHYAQNTNPKKSITENIPIVPQNNDEIVNFVIDEMKDILG